jgi:hypothetical protein
MPALYFKDDLDLYLALFPDLQAHTMRALRHLAWCHADDGTILMTATTSPETAILSVYCATCDAPEAQIALRIPGGVRFPPCPHEDEGPWDVWYAEGGVVIACHLCQNVQSHCMVATAEEFDDGL